MGFDVGKIFNPVEHVKAGGVDKAISKEANKPDKKNSATNAQFGGNPIQQEITRPSTQRGTMSEEDAQKLKVLLSILNASKEDKATAAAPSKAEQSSSQSAGSGGGNLVGGVVNGVLGAAGGIVNGVVGAFGNILGGLGGSK